MGKVRQGWVRAGRAVDLARKAAEGRSMRMRRCMCMCMAAYLARAVRDPLRGELLLQRGQAGLQVLCVTLLRRQPRAHRLCHRARLEQRRVAAAIHRWRADRARAWARAARLDPSGGSHTAAVIRRMAARPEFAHLVPFLHPCDDRAWLLAPARAKHQRLFPFRLPRFAARPDSSEGLPQGFNVWHRLWWVLCRHPAGA